ncbi:alpha/beta fold hydrolase [Orrella daihaiensis]|uniref:Alpha/beta fold hydrolase n=1 Tax=Orrella daihaiensis TaxID=2782176 RepID=A0ABY4AH49_9BURK|nr:alpha/beta fold hydrolase [Orrella daihaiensis]UOD49619.1 alpha/beta fold hydrolase [Orrella daihaiensis]
MPLPDQHFELGELELALGDSLPNARLAYVTLGTLNSRGDNAILVLHGYTSSHRFVLEDDPDNAEGSWGPLIGPGKAIDTNRYFVIAPNALGSSYGSTGPGDINERTGKRWGPEFPALTFEDQTNAQQALLAWLGVQQLHAVMGLSMGGFGAFQWAVQYPEKLRKVIPVLTAPWGSLNQAASHQAVTAVLESSAAWHNGWYYEHLSQMQDTLEGIRIKTLERYGVPAWLESELHDAIKVQARLHDMARHWAAKFDANAMLALRAMINRFDVRARLTEAHAELLYVLCRTDSLFPPSIVSETLDQWPKSAGTAKYVEIDSDYGHFASSLDWHKWAGALKQFLDH